MKFRFSDVIGCSNGRLTAAADIILPDDAGYLQERILILEKEKIDLQRLVCELLKKNEELRLGERSRK